jgi:hypothetical protein
MRKFERRENYYKKYGKFFEENGKGIWRSTEYFHLHAADSEDYLTLIAMTATKK